MKKILAMLLAAVMLGLSVSAVVAENGDTLPTLANTSQLTVTEDGYVTGIGTNVTAEELVRNFNNRSAIKITAPDGTELSGKQSVPADAAITAGGSEALHALIYCDANRDGKIGMADIILTIRYAIDTNSADICATAVDFNENGRIDTVDIVTLICYIAGWEIYPGGIGAPEKAANEDSDITMYFETMMNKIGRSDTASTGNYSYTIKMAKNERESAQVYISTVADKEDMMLEVTPFTDAAGNTLESELCYEYYYDMSMFYDVNTGYVKTHDDYYGEALPKLEKPFKLTANQSKAFVIRVKTVAETPSGLYKATVNLKDSAGIVVKTATVYTCVWDLTLSDETACATSFNLSPGMVSSYTKNYDSEAYKPYYDYFLDNRMCSFLLPYDITDERADEYLSNPRVTSFVIAGDADHYGGAHARDDDQIVAYWNKLQSKEEWSDKGYFYYGDEVYTPAAMEKYYRDTNAHLTNLIGTGFRQIAVISSLTYYKQFEQIDIVDFIEPYVGLWCPQSTAYTMNGDRHRGEHVNYFNDTRRYKYYGGNFDTRIAKFRERGDKIWWYICESPEFPYANFFGNYQGVIQRDVLWQQYLFNTDGILYWLANEWDSCSRTRYESGAGILMFYSQLFRQEEEGPVGSIKLENIRDDIEDFQYMKMLEDEIGRDAVLEYVKEVTTEILEYTENPDVLASAREAIAYRLMDELEK